MWINRSWKWLWSRLYMGSGNSHLWHLKMQGPSFLFSMIILGLFYIKWSRTTPIDRMKQWEVRWPRNQKKHCVPMVNLNSHLPLSAANLLICKAGYIYPISKHSLNSKFLTLWLDIIQISFFQKIILSEFAKCL